MKGETVLFLGCGDLGIRAGHSLLQAGARVIGGCCRTGPDDIAELRTALDGGDFPA